MVDVEELVFPTKSPPSIEDDDIDALSVHPMRNDLVIPDVTEADRAFSCCWRLFPLSRLTTELFPVKDFVEEPYSPLTVAAPCEGSSLSMLLACTLLTSDDWPTLIED